MSAPRNFAFSDFAGDVALIADGLGGHRAGERASDLVASAFLSNTLRLESTFDVVEVLQNANKSIYDLAAANTLLEGMGTTVAGLACLPDKLIWFNVGDSKIFRFRDGVLHQLSVDDVALMTTTTGLRKPALTQSLGGAPKFHDVAPHVGVEPVTDGWKYLICSDGLTDVVSIPAIEQVLSLSDEIAVQRLLDAALAQGAPDNVSVILLSVNARSAAPKVRLS
ncbi:PP2C family protein-serine/threonine phosphatase [Ruegeria arenilitoris]|uniref:PP2C family protein-serine/threonine phosphatase n=1 Tax=Ruegeria arenilitoris TaxID=1173585 RepID=UPI001480621F|nr:protein phosphatase 2C domain-containing protein [Ruegeria arenilitoris]